MLAARMYGIEDIRVEEIPIPTIKEDEVLLKVKAASICGTDVRMYKNGYAGITADTPRILGHEISGIIEQVGSAVMHYEAGQRVAVAPNMGCGVCSQCIKGDGHLCRTYQALGINIDGGFAQYVVIPGRAVAGGNIAVLEDHVSFEEAAINEALSCVCNGFERCEIRPGDNVLIVGAGPIGIMHGMMAKMAGAGRVYINDLSEERLAICKEMDNSFITVKNDIMEIVMNDTKGEGVDVCITACPSPAAQAMALEISAYNARINFFGGSPASKQIVGLNTNLIHYKQLKVSGTTRASLTQFRKTLQFISTGVLDVRGLITSKLPLEQIQDGFELAAAAKGLKNVITM